MNSPLQGGTRRRQSRVRWVLPTLFAVLLAAAGAGLWFAEGRDTGGGHATGPPANGSPQVAAAAKPESNVPPSLSLSGPNAFRVKFHGGKPRAALVFDMKTGRVLYRRNPLQVLPIASLTKVMTALIVVDRTRPHDKARITHAALAYSGSGVGILPKKKNVPVEGLMYGLLLPSGNDAAIALADHVAGTERRFVRLMNRRAQELHLRCTRYVTSYGLQAGNRSCAADLAVLARLAMREPRIARIVGKANAHPRFPVKGGHLWLHSTNPLYTLHYPGTVGLKTGFTDKAGHCFIGVVRRGGRELGVVLLHSPDTGDQASALFDAALGIRHRPRIVKGR